MVLHVKYPSMERQDLTQSQLGAFKFTPVDEEPRPSYIPHTYPSLVNQFSRSAYNGSFDPGLTSPDISADPTFFNTQIKPYLDTSRLQLGPAAVRAAVESASSPSKRMNRSAQDAMASQVQTFHPRLQGISENDSTTSLFTDYRSNLASDTSGQTFSSTSTSLLRALESEQEAHEITKAGLERETVLRQDAESQRDRFSEHNQSLLNSIKLLQSTVRHMVRQQENQNEKQQTSNTALLTPQNFEPHMEQKLSHTYDPQDVGADVLQPLESDVCDPFAPMALEVGVFDSSQPSDNSKTAEKQRALRNELTLKSGPNEEKNPNIDYQQKIKAFEKQVDHAALKTEPDRELAHHPNEPSQSIKSSAHGQVRALAPNPVDIPFSSTAQVFTTGPSFLEKWGAISSASNSKQRKAMIEDKILSTPEETAKNTIPPVNVFFPPDSYLIDWKIDATKFDELRGSNLEFNTANGFREHPIRYVPDLTDRDLYRTVMIDFIPLGATYFDILDEIRCSVIESIQMFEPIGKATTFVTARVVFRNELGAVELYKRGQNPGITVNGARLRVWQVSEPTYPRNQLLEEHIYDHGCTRILVMNSGKDDIKELLQRKLRFQINQGLVLNIGRTTDDEPMVEFTSIDEAVKAMHKLMDDRDFVGTSFDFDRDYCAAGYNA